ncbi:MFS transporter, partial [Anaerosalibacter bizertensis]|nr:MFS transporter [Anaerosalibacter bizertensis]
PNNIPIPLYLSVMSSLFFIFYTIVGAPYNALIPELSQSYEDRLNLSTWQSIFRLIYSAIAMIMPGFLIKYFDTNSVTQGIQKKIPPNWKVSILVSKVFFLN